MPYDSHKVREILQRVNADARARGAAGEIAELLNESLRPLGPVRLEELLSVLNDPFPKIPADRLRALKYFERVPRSLPQEERAELDAMRFRLRSVVDIRSVELNHDPIDPEPRKRGGASGRGRFPVSREGWGLIPYCYDFLQARDPDKKRCERLTALLLWALRRAEGKHGRPLANSTIRNRLRACKAARN